MSCGKLNITQQSTRFVVLNTSPDSEARVVPIILKTKSLDPRSRPCHWRLSFVVLWVVKREINPKSSSILRLVNWYLLFWDILYCLMILYIYICILIWYIHIYYGMQRICKPIWDHVQQHLSGFDLLKCDIMVCNQLVKYCTTGWWMKDVGCSLSPKLWWTYLRWWLNHQAVGFQWTCSVYCLLRCCCLLHNCHATCTADKHNKKHQTA